MPKDPIILLSYINTQLRDYYPTLDAFCEDTGTDMAELEGKLKAVGYEYNEVLNQFR